MTNYDIKLPIFITLALIFSKGIFAAGEPGIFELKTPIYQFEIPGNSRADSKYFAGPGTEFYIENRDEKSGIYEIYFPDQDDITPPKDTSLKAVTEGQLYRIKSDDLSPSAYRTNWILDHGALIVPFKLREKDNSLSGESTIGYYLGSKSDYAFFSGTVFASAGLSLISVNNSETGSSENHTGYTWSIGYAFDSRDDFQAAIVVGQDRLGGSAGDNWEYEGDTWISVAIGFGFLGSKEKINTGGEQ